MRLLKARLKVLLKVRIRLPKARLKVLQGPNNAPERLVSGPEGAEQVGRSGA